MSVQSADKGTPNTTLTGDTAVRNFLVGSGAKVPPRNEGITSSHGSGAIDSPSWPMNSA